MKEDDVVLPFLHLHCGIGKVWKPGGKLRQLMVVGREEGTAPVNAVQVFERCPRDGQAVECRRAPPDLVKDHE